MSGITYIKRPQWIQGKIKKEPRGFRPYNTVQDLLQKNKHFLINVTYPGYLYKRSEVGERRNK